VGDPPDTTYANTNATPNTPFTRTKAYANAKLPCRE
jgi:hypothetical protein